MRRLIVLALLAGCLTACASPIGGHELGTSAWPGTHAFVFAQDAEEEEGRNGLITALLYLPNRIFDVLDIVRARVRLGPGFAVGARATALADVFAGSYLSVFVGLPGPRNRTIPKLPAGLESRTGAAVSVVDATVEGPIGPDYGPAEFGFTFQLAILGVDVGIEPGEILDFLAGLATFDPRDDDF